MNALASVDPPSLVFVHLSDLHFRDGSSGLAQREAGLRNRLLDDIPKAVGLTRAGTVEAILITGDIARSGQQAEYQVAREWLDQLCSLLEISPTKTLTCPGNHDVDRTRLGETRMKSNEDLRRCSEPLMDAMIDRLLGEPDQAVLAPLENYNEFAAGTACSIEDFLAWELPPIAFGGGYSVSVRGATSVVNSDENDGPGTMAVQSNQLRVNQYPGRLNLLLIHHSPHFWIKPVPGPAQYGHHLALYGHTHQPHHQVVNGTCLELTAGAVHPEESEMFAIPGYNVIEISVADPTDSSGAATVGRVEVFHREFSVVDDRFKDGSGAPDVNARIEIPRLIQAEGSAQPPPDEPSLGEVGPPVDSSDIRAPLETATGEPDPSRLVRLAFERLGAGDRVRVLDRMGLLSDELVGLPPHRLIREVAGRVVDAGLVADFMNTVAEVES
ncbi:MAG: metallophosphoesterase [Gaiellaceae bacterium]